MSAERIDFTKNPGTRVDLSSETRAFLRDWMAWVERGAPQGGPYFRFDGLCLAACDYPNSLTAGEDLPFRGNPWGRMRNVHLDDRRLAFVRANMDDEPELENTRPVRVPVGMTGSGL